MLHIHLRRDGRGNERPLCHGHNRHVDPNWAFPDSNSNLNSLMAMMRLNVSVNPVYFRQWRTGWFIDIGNIYILLFVQEAYDSMVAIQCEVQCKGKVKSESCATFIIPHCETFTGAEESSGRPPVITEDDDINLQRLQRRPGPSSRRSPVSVLDTVSHQFASV